MKLNIQTKLLGAFGLMIALMIAVFAVGFWGMNTIANDTTEIVTVDLVEDIGVRELEVLILEQTATYEDFVITGNEEDLAISSTRPRPYTSTSPHLKKSSTGTSRCSNSCTSSRTNT